MFLTSVYFEINTFLNKIFYFPCKFHPMRTFQKLNKMDFIHPQSQKLKKTGLSLNMYITSDFNPIHDLSFNWCLYTFKSQIRHEFSLVFTKSHRLKINPYVNFCFTVTFKCSAVLLIKISLNTIGKIKFSHCYHTTE